RQQWHDFGVVSDNTEVCILKYRRFGIFINRDDDACSAEADHMFKSATNTDGKVQFRRNCPTSEPDLMLSGKPGQVCDVTCSSKWRTTEAHGHSFNARQVWRPANAFAYTNSNLGRVESCGPSRVRAGSGEDPHSTGYGIVEPKHLNAGLTSRISARFFQHPRSYCGHLWCGTGEDRSDNIAAERRFVL